MIKINENQEKLTFIQKRYVKKFVKQAKNELRKLHAGVNDYEKTRQELLKAVLSLTDIFEIINDDGDIISIEQLNELDVDDLTSILEEILQEMENEI